LVDPGRNGGTIGAAGYEAEAVQEACATIEGLISGVKGSAGLAGSLLLLAPSLIHEQ